MFMYGIAIAENYAIKALRLKRQAFAGASQKGSVGKSRLRNRQTAVVDVESSDLVPPGSHPTKPDRVPRRNLDRQSS